MKKIIAVIGILTLAIGQLAVSAQEQELPIRSQDALRQYAMKQAVYGYKTVTSPGIDWNCPSNSTSATASGVCGEDVLNALSEMGIYYDVINSNDTVRAYAYLFDDDRNCLFFGLNSYPIGGSPVFSLCIQDIPLPLLNVKSAQILVLGKDGESVNTIDLPFSNGKPVIPWWYAGSWNGILIVRYNNGTTVSYELWDPTPKSPDFISEVVAAMKVESHYVYRFTGSTNSGIKIMETYNRPSAYIELKHSQEVSVDVLGLYYGDNGQPAFERPQSMILEDQSSGLIFEISTPGTSIPKSMFPAGKFRIIWNWDKFGKPNTIYTPNVPVGGGIG